MEMTYKAEDRQLTIALSGELDHHGAKGLMDAIDRCMEQHLPVKTFLDLRELTFMDSSRMEQHLPVKTFLDLRELTFMDSSGIAVVLRAKRRMEALAGTLVVVNIPRQAARVLETAGLSRYIDLV